MFNRGVLVLTGYAGCLTSTTKWHRLRQSIESPELALGLSLAMAFAGVVISDLLLDIGYINITTRRTRADLLTSYDRVNFGRLTSSLQTGLAHLHVLLLCLSNLAPIHNILFL
jgi:hypothetical protein